MQPHQDFTKPITRHRGLLDAAKEDEQMHRRAEAVYEFYRAGQRPRATDQGLPPRSPNSVINPPRSLLDAPSSVSYTVVPDAEHELWHPNYLQALKTSLNRLTTEPAKSVLRTPNPEA
ncbi:MAG: hypothetical protein HY302_02315 [Opitutae bacterium]|nr:hypothetical protein [Opitutae bacterium]